MQNGVRWMEMNYTGGEQQDFQTLVQKDLLHRIFFFCPLSSYSIISMYKTTSFEY